MKISLAVVLISLLAYGCSTPSSGVCDAMSREFKLLREVEAEYPKSALSKGITGWVLLEHTVTITGEVERIKVLAEEPKGVFTKAAIEALKKFKYQPPCAAYESFEVPGVQMKFSFGVNSK